MRIVLDVSPLSRPRTGIGNYVRGMVAGLAEAAAGEHELVAFGPSGPNGRRRIRESLAGLPIVLRLPLLPRAQAWRAGWSRLGRPPVESVVGRLDVFHFSDWMYPSQRGGVRATTVHDLVPLRFPEWVEPATLPHARAEVRERRTHLRPGLRQFALHGGRGSRAARRARGADRGRVPGGRSAFSSRGGPGRPGWPLRARRLDARAAQEPARAGRRVHDAAAPAARADARACGARGLGGSPAGGGGRAPPRIRLGRGARPALPRRKRLRVPVSLRGVRHPGRRGARERDTDRRLVASVAGRGLRRRSAARRPGRPGRLRGRARGGARRPPRRTAASPTPAASPGEPAARPSWPATRRAASCRRLLLSSNARGHRRLVARAHAGGHGAPHRLAARGSRARARRGAAPLRAGWIEPRARAGTGHRLVPRRPAGEAKRDRPTSCTARPIARR